jgi:hypothetical protein
VQRGEAPLRYLIIPHDWGIKGVETNLVIASGLDAQNLADLQMLAKRDTWRFPGGD